MKCFDKFVTNKNCTLDIFDIEHQMQTRLAIIA